MWKHVLAVAGAAVLGSLGCGGSSITASDAAIDASPGAADADPAAPDANPAAPDANPAAPDASPTAADGGSAPTVCGGFGGGMCDAMHFCDWTPNSCGSADQTGVCVVRPELCPEVYNPVCGCDHMTYSNECFANAAGQDIISTGVCP